jgi:hypothetical protein
MNFLWAGLNCDIDWKPIQTWFGITKQGLSGSNSKVLIDFVSLSWSNQFNGALYLSSFMGCMS